MTATTYRTVATGARYWVLDLPDQPYPSLNGREHWSVKNRKAQAWRTATRLLAREAKVPALDAIVVRLDYWPPDRRRRDRDNLMAVVKHCIDGLRDAHVIVDDDADRVTFTAPVIHPARDDRQPMWLLTIEEEAPNVHGG